MSDSQYEPLPSPSKNSQSRISSHIRSSSSSHIAESESLARPSDEIVSDEIVTVSAETPNEKKPGELECQRSLLGIFDKTLRRSWSIEIICCIISAVATISLIIVLNQYDQKATPSWALGITLNTLLAFLTAVSQAGFVHPVIQGMSQMKWNWFTDDKDKPLSDFERFDSASRGIWGSILLTFSVKGRIPVLMATIILLSSTITSTITQAALTQVTQYVPSSGTATIRTMLSGYTLNDVSLMYGSLLSAALGSVNTTYNSTDPICTSGNCKFPIFSSLAVCVETHDITDTLISECPYDFVTENGEEEECASTAIANLAQNKGFYLQGGDGVESILNLTNIQVGNWTFPKEGNGYPDEEKWAQIESFSRSSFAFNGISAAQIIYLNQSDMEKYWYPTRSDYMSYVRAVEAMFYICVETYNVTTTNVSTQSTITATARNLTDFIYPNATFTVDNINYTFVSPDGLPYALSRVLSPILTGSYSIVSDPEIGSRIKSGESHRLTAFSYAVTQALHPSYVTDDGWATSTPDDQVMLDNLQDLLRNTARVATNWLRENHGTIIQGQNYAPSAYVIVRWPYIACLATQVVLSTIFLAWVIVDTQMRKVRVVKESALSTLFALSAEDRLIVQNRLGDYVATGNINKDIIEAVGDSLKVHLVKGDFGMGHLKLASCNLVPPDKNT